MNFQMRLPTIGLASHSAYRPEVKSAAKKTVPTEERAIELDSRFFFGENDISGNSAKKHQTGTGNGKKSLNT